MQIYAFSSKPPSKTEKICKLLENHQKICSLLSLRDHIHCTHMMVLR